MPTADALHVEMADEAVPIGPPPAAQSYLLVEKIVAACQQTGAEAVHPGYGFLSERATFAEALAKAGIAFIGPNAKAIAAMGDKIESKKLALAAKVSTVPGFIGEIRDASARQTDRQGDRLSGDGEGLGRRRRQGPAHRAQGSRARAGHPVLAERSARRASATTGCSSRNSSPSRATSKSR